MQIISANDILTSLPEILSKGSFEPLAIQNQGKKAGVLISYEDYERLTSSELQKFQSLCNKIRSNALEKGLTEEIFGQIISEERND